MAAQTEPTLGSLEWFANRLNQPVEPTQLNGYYIEFTDRKWPVDGDSATLEELRSRVQGKPEHPERRQLERLEKQLELDGFLWRYRIWYQDDEHWRVSSDTDDPDVPIQFHDAAQSGPSDSWMWAQGSLTLYDAGHLPEGQSSSTLLLHLQQFVRCFVDVSIRVARPPVSPTTSRLDGTTWLATAESDDRSRVINYQGSLSPSGTAIELLLVEHKNHPNPKFQGMATFYSDWAYDEALHRRIPHVIKRVSGDGRLEDVCEYGVVRPLHGGEIEEVTRTPDAIAGTDAIRDATLIEEIIDRRPGGGSVVNAHTGQETGTLKPEEVGSNLGSLYWIAWGAAGALVAGIVWLRVRR